VKIVIYCKVANLKDVRPIEGYFIETTEGLIFDVKGLLHPPDRVIAYVRYVPDPNGERVRRNGVRYRKVYALSKREELIKRRFPEYTHYDEFFNRWLQSVPIRRIKEVYDPCLKLRELIKLMKKDELETLACELAERLTSAGVSLDSIGISGSLLVELHTESSDIDLVVYGEREGRRVHDHLKKLLKSGKEIRAYTKRELLKLYEFRSQDTLMPLNVFLRVEERKVLEGIFKGRDFYIRLVKRPEEYGESYGQRRYYPIGRAKVIAKVVDDKDSIFTPCKYLVSEVEVLRGSIPYPLKEVVSFRGRFCEQAMKGERVVVNGVVEVVKSKGYYCRILIGEHVDDVMYPLEMV